MKPKSVRPSLAAVVVAALVVAGTVSPAGAAPDPTGSDPAPAGALTVTWPNISCDIVTLSNKSQTIALIAKVKSQVNSAPGDDTYYQKIKLRAYRWSGVGTGEQSGDWRASFGPGVNVTKPSWTEDDLKTYSTQGLKDTMISAGATATALVTIQINRERDGADTTVWKTAYWAPKSVECPDSVASGKSAKVEKGNAGTGTEIKTPYHNFNKNKPTTTSTTTATDKDPDDGVDLTKYPEYYGPPPPGRDCVMQRDGSCV